MDDKKLFALLEAVRSGSLSKAAAELGYTQSGLTQMMNSLEDELGCCLLVRSYNGIKLTPAGEQLLPLIEDAAGSLKRLKDEANQTSAGQNKPIRIGVFPSISKSWLPYVLKEYQRRCPGTSIEITVGNIEMQTWLEHDMVDIVLGEESMKAGYRWIPLREDYYFGVVPAEHPLSGGSGFR
jgi:DNA-binding transcriptional LysR family regulator